MVDSGHLNDISQLIRVKERELHEIHDIRCNQLEKMIVERDALLVEASKRFEQLKDDFKYNLTLLDARDIEIVKLEKMLSSETTKNTSLAEESDSVKSKLAFTAQQMTEREMQYAEEKAGNKKMLIELKEQIEQLGWASAEETKAKIRENVSLRKEIDRLSASRDESLETQRRDLTNTFELLLEQREEAFSMKEREISKQISLLDNRFEQLRTDNSRLKSELGDALRRQEVLSEESSVKEDQLRQLQWRTDDERTAKLQNDDSMQRHIQQLSLDLNITRDTCQREAAEYQKNLEKAALDLQREMEFRLTAEKRLEETRSLSQEECVRIDRDLREARAREETLQREVAALRYERDDAFDRAAIARSEADTGDAKVRAFSRDCMLLREEIAGLRIRGQDQDSEISRLERLIEDLRRDSGESNKKALERAAEELLRFQEEAKAAALLHREQLQVKLDELRRSIEEEAAQRIQDTASKYEADAAELADRLRFAESQVSEQKRIADEKAAELRHEQAESAALRLRLKFHEHQQFNRRGEEQDDLFGAGEAMADMGGRLYGRETPGGADYAATSFPAYESSAHPEMGPTAGREGRGSGSGSGTRGGDRDSARHETLPQLDRIDIFDASAPSPMFSDDFGSVSIPTSPVATPQGFIRPNGRGRAGGRGWFGNHQAAIDSRPSVGGGAQGYGDTRKGARYAASSPTGFLPHGQASPGSVEGESVAAAMAAAAVAEAAQSSAALALENGRLKAVIREMRSDVEHLQSQLADQSQTLSSASGSPTAPRRQHQGVDASVVGGGDNIGVQDGSDSEVRSKDNAAAGVLPSASASPLASPVSPDRVNTLELRLQQMAGEVTRLREERRKLMDVGNELRSALNKSQQSRVSHAPTLPSGSGSDPVFHWLTSEPSSIASEEQSRRRDVRGCTAAESVPVVPPELAGRGRREVKAWTDDDYSSAEEKISRSSIYSTAVDVKNDGVVGQALYSSRPHSGSSVSSTSTGSKVRSGGAGVPGFSSNSDRATLSQLKARQRLTAKATATTAAKAGNSSTGVAFRRVVNYAKGDFDDA